MAIVMMMFRILWFAIHGIDTPVIHCINLIYTFIISLQPFPQLDE